MHPFAQSGEDRRDILRDNPNTLVPPDPSRAKVPMRAHPSPLPTLNSDHDVHGSRHLVTI